MRRAATIISGTKVYLSLRSPLGFAAQSVTICFLWGVGASPCLRGLAEGASRAFAAGLWSMNAHAR
jgi:hypothetical protein